MIRIIPICFVLLLASCSEEGKIADEMRDIPIGKWNYDQIPEFPFNVDKTSVTYNFYLKLRIQKSYPYENLYLLTHLKTPSGKLLTQQVNFNLTDDLGRPHGKSSGNSIDYELVMFTNKRLDEVGQYSIALEQNLRDSVVKGVESIGIKIKEGDPVF